MRGDEGEQTAEGPATHADGPATSEKGQAKSDGSEPAARAPSAAFKQAKARHAQSSAFLHAFLTKGRTEMRTRDGAVWPNTCEWLLTGRTPVHVATPTHDSLERANAYKQPTMRAFFGVADTLANPTDYEEFDLRHNRNIALFEPNLAGAANHEWGIVIVEPRSQSREALQNTLVHETRHASDHRGSEFPVDQYPSEFDAYWHDPKFAKYSARSGTADDALTTTTGKTLDGFDNARQQQIFKFMHDKVDSVFHTYWYTRYFWDLPDPQVVAMFRTHVRPAGVNLVNSPRIDDVYLELHAATIDFEALRRAVGRLQKSDLVAIEGLGMRKEWRDLLATKLSAEQAREIRRSMGV